MPNIDQFLTDNFHILSYLCSLRDKDGRVSITQQEIADKFGLSRATVNKIIGELKSKGYIEPDGRHVCRYLIKQSSTNVGKVNPSCAACVCFGGYVNGWAAWELPNGKPLDYIRDKKKKIEDI